jgi:hypothetical protein
MQSATSSRGRQRLTLSRTSDAISGPAAAAMNAAACDSKVTVVSGWGLRR